MGITKVAGCATFAWQEVLLPLCSNHPESTGTRIISPRGKLTRERLHVSVAFDLRNPVVGIRQRKLNYSFMAAEALWILSGDDSATPVVEYNSRMLQFSDDGETFAGAYGPPVVNQLDWCVEQLLQDVDTRQSVLTIWKQKPEPSKDIPCTIAMTFNIRQDKLNCHVFMRSSDTYIGLPYDFFVFSMIAWKVCCEYNAQNVYKRDIFPGALYWTGVSSHLYETEFEDAQKVTFGAMGYMNPMTRAELNWHNIESQLVMARDKSEPKTVYSEAGYWRVRPWWKAS